MTWGIPVNDPKTSAEIYARIRETKRRMAASEEAARLEISKAAARRIRREAEARYKKLIEERDKAKAEKSAWMARVEAMIEANAADFKPAVRDFIWVGQTNRASFRQPAKRYARRIIAWVAKRYGYTAADIIGPSRSANLVKARHLAMQLAGHSGFVKVNGKWARRLSLGQAREVFKRDHTTLLHAFNKAPSYRSRNAAWIKDGSVRLHQKQAEGKSGQQPEQMVLFA